MSTEHNNQPHKSKGEHGTMTSYVVGFILSLVLTIDAYYLVVNKVFKGDALLVTILVLAVVQMAIQLFFFLHLGRGPKPLYNVVFLFATASMILVVVGASIFIMSNLYRNMSPAEVTQKLSQDENIAEVGGVTTGACKATKENHKVTIADGAVTPNYTKAVRCDTLTIINDSGKDMDFMYGTYPVAKSYGGQDGVSVRKNRPETITLNEIGEFGFYATDDYTVSAQFTVSE